MNRFAYMLGKGTRRSGHVVAVVGVGTAVAVKRVAGGTGEFVGDFAHSYAQGFKEAGTFHDWVEAPQKDEPAPRRQRRAPKDITDDAQRVG